MAKQMKLADAYVEVSATSTALGAGLAAAHTKVAAGMASIGNSLRSAFSMMTGMGTLMGAGIAAALGAGVKSAMELEKSFRQVEFKLGEFRASAREVNEAAASMAREVGIGQNRVVQMILSVIDAGRSAEDAMAITGAALRASVAGFEDVNQIMGPLITVMQKFDVPAQRVNKLLDMFAMGAKIGRGSIAEMLQAVVTLTDTMRTAHMPLADTIALLAEMTKTGDTMAIAAQRVQKVMEALYVAQRETGSGPKVKGLDISVERIEREGLLAVLQDVAKASESDVQQIGRRYQAYVSLRELLKAMPGLIEAIDKVQYSSGLVAKEYARSQETASQRVARAYEVVKQGLTRAGAALVDAWAGVSNKLISIWDVIGAGVVDGLARILDALETSSSWWEGLTSRLTKLWDDAALSMVGWEETAVQVFLMVAKAGSDMVDALRYSWDLMVADARAAWAMMDKGAADFTATLGNKMLTFYDRVVDAAMAFAFMSKLITPEQYGAHLRGRRTEVDRAAVLAGELESHKNALRSELGAIPTPQRQTTFDEDYYNQQMLDLESRREVKKRYYRAQKALFDAAYGPESSDVYRDVGEAFRQALGRIADEAEGVIEHKFGGRRSEVFSPRLIVGAGRLAAAFDLTTEEEKANAKRQQMVDLLKHIDVNTRNRRLFA